MAAITVAAGGGWGVTGVGAARPALGLRWRRGSVYRRRRLVAAGLVALVAGVVFVLGASLAGSGVLGVLGGGPLTASEAGSSPATAVGGEAAGEVVHLRAQPVSRTTYVVVEGDTLWSIARRLKPTGDIRPLVDALSAARHGRPLQVGEPVVMPHVPAG